MKREKRYKAKDSVLRTLSFIFTEKGNYKINIKSLIMDEIKKIIENKSNSE